jgi:F-type H+-transporting ATPase subunit b
MSGKNGILLVLVLLPLFLFLTPGEAEKAAGTADFAGKVVNFLLLFGGLGFFLYKPMRAFLENKTSEIRRFLEEAKSSRKEAEDRYEATMRRVEGLSGEIAKMKAEAEAQGNKEKARIAKQAEEEAARVLRLVRQEIDAHTQTGIREVRTFVAETATSLARERIRKNLVPDDHSLLVDKSIERLSKLDEKSTAG